jgi:hypothetical protein
MMSRAAAKQHNQRLLIRTALHSALARALELYKRSAGITDDNRVLGPGDDFPTGDELRDLAARFERIRELGDGLAPTAKTAPTRPALRLVGGRS